MPSSAPKEGGDGPSLREVNGNHNQYHHREANGIAKYIVEKDCIASSSSLKQAANSHASISQFAPSTQSNLPPGSLLIRQTLKAGRGVFANVELKAGTLVEVSHVLLFSAEEYEHYGKYTQLDEYTYIWQKGPEGNTMALALGLGSLFNHSHNSHNVRYMLDRECGTIRYTLTRDVLPGEELLISYGTGEMWFEKVFKSSDIENGTTSSYMIDASHDQNDGSSDSDERLENELMALSQVGIFHEDQDSTHTKRQQDTDRDLRNHLEYFSTPTPPASMTPLLTPPASVGPEAAPLWRITSAVDPRTSPLELMLVWAVEIDPQKTSNFLKFSRSIAIRLKAAEEGGDGQEHRMTRRNDNLEEEEDEDDEDDGEDDDSDEEDDSMKHLSSFHRMREGGGLIALVARVQDIPSVEKVTALLNSVDVVLDRTVPMPFQVRVPRHPAPSRERLNEWKIHWPVAVKHGKRVDLLLKTSLSDSLTSQQGSYIPGVVDRAADARLWTDHATNWAIKNFKICIELARHAKSLGELPIGVHVIPAYNEAQTENGNVNESEEKSWIEVDSWDTRTSERNPIKHGVTNAIRNVAKLRSDRDRERLQALCAIVATLNRNPNAHPHSERVTSKTEEVSNGSSSPRLANNQDYLLNNLTLFTTHEPCMYCCMALVHSRVRSVFFIKPSPGAGGCCGSSLREDLRCSHAQDGGPYAVQEQAGLNHHFDVWKWVGDDDLLLSFANEDLNDLLDIHGLDA